MIPTLLIALNSFTPHNKQSCESVVKPLINLAVYYSTHPNNPSRFDEDCDLIKKWVKKCKKKVK